MKKSFLSVQKKPRPQGSSEAHSRSPVKGAKDPEVKEEEEYNFARELFKVFAPNNKSYIEASEIKRLLEVFKSSIPSLMAARIMSEVDANGDGTIDFKGIKFFNSRI